MMKNIKKAKGGLLVELNRLEKNRGSMKEQMEFMTTIPQELRGVVN